MDNHPPDIWDEAIESAFNSPSILRASELRTNMRVQQKDARDKRIYIVTMCFCVDGGFDGLDGRILESETTGGQWVIIFQPRTGKNDEPKWVLIESDSA